MTTAIITRPATSADAARISGLHELAFGPGRFARTAYRVREGTPAVSPFCRVALDADTLIAALRLTEVAIGGRHGALLLGPLAVAPALAGQGHGRRLVAESLETAKKAGVALVVLVGDEPYYGRFGFHPVNPGHILFPGPVNPARILAAELDAGALAAFCGLVEARRVTSARRGLKS